MMIWIENRFNPQTKGKGTGYKQERNGNIEVWQLKEKFPEA